MQQPKKGISSKKAKKVENKNSKSASWLLPFLHAKKTYEIKNAVAVVFKVVGIFLQFASY